MTSIIESILKKRNVTVFLSIENQSQYYGVKLMSPLFPLRLDVKDKNIILIPTNVLNNDCEVTPNVISYCGKEFRCVFTKTSQYNNNAFILSTVGDVNNEYVEGSLLPFINQTSCKQIVLCDIGVLKKRDFVQLYNNVSKCLETLNVAVCLASIIGYNSRGYSDIETEKEKDFVTHEFYLTKEHDDSECVDDKLFRFRQISKVFDRSDIAYICSLTKNSIETKIKEIKNDASKTNIKMLCELGLIDKGLNSRLSNDCNIDTVLEFLSKIGLTNSKAFNILEPKWEYNYKQLLNKIINTKEQSQKSTLILDYIKVVKNDVNKIDKYISEL